MKVSAHVLQEERGKMVKTIERERTNGSCGSNKFTSRETKKYFVNARITAMSVYVVRAIVMMSLSPSQSINKLRREMILLGNEQH